MYIVKFYEDFIEDDELILIMDYCEGIYCMNVRHGPGFPYLEYEKEREILQWKRCFYMDISAYPSCLVYP